MPKKYNEQQIRAEFADYLEKGFNPETFYRQRRFFNKKGRSSEGRPYTEIYSELILQYGIVERLDEIACVYRTKSYNPDEHAIFTVNEGTDQVEKTIAKALLGKHYASFGVIIGFEIPLQDKSKDIGGDIDLLSYDSATNRTYILELKEPKSPETLLRCAIEAYTYSKRVNHAKLLSDFFLPEDSVIIPAALVFDKSQAADEFYSLNTRPFLQKLLSKLNVQTFVIHIEDIPQEFIVDRGRK